MKKTTKKIILSFIFCILLLSFTNIVESETTFVYIKGIANASGVLVSISYDGEYVSYANTNENTIKIYNVTSGNLVKTFSSATNAPATSIFFKNKNWIAVWFRSNQYIYDVENDTTIQTFGFTCDALEYDEVTVAYDGSYFISVNTYSWWPYLFYWNGSAYVKQSDILDFGNNRLNGIKTPANNNINMVVGADKTGDKFKLYSINSTYNISLYSTVSYNEYDTNGVTDFEIKDFLWYDNYGYLATREYNGSGYAISVFKIAQNYLYRIKRIPVTYSNYPNMIFTEDGTLIIAYNKNTVKQYSLSGTNMYLLREGVDIPDNLDFGTNKYDLIDSTYIEDENKNILCLSDITNNILRFYQYTSLSNETNNICETCPDKSIGLYGLNEDLSVTISSSTSIKYLWYYYRINRNMNVTKVYLQVHKDMYDAGLPLSNYQMKINGQGVFYANRWLEVDTDSYALVWENFNVNISAETYIMFKAEQPYYSHNGYYQYWYVDVMTSEVNNDDFLQFRFLTDDALWNSFSSNWNVFPSTGNDDLLIKPYDLLLMMCIEEGLPVSIHDWYTDSLCVEPSTVHVNNTVSITYFLKPESLGYSSYIYIDKSGTIVEKIKLPNDLQSGCYWYTPTSSGTYTVNLSVNDINVSSDSFIASGYDSYSIYTIPNPSHVGETFTVFYVYPSTEHYGRIVFINSDDETVKTFIIDKNSVGNLDVVNGLPEGLYTVKLQLFINNNTFVDMDTNIHCIGYGYSNYISVDKYSITVGQKVTIYATHNHLGQPVFIKYGNKYKYVGDKNEYFFDNIFYESGVFSISLVLRTCNNEFILAKTLDLIVGTGVPSGETNPIFPVIEQPLASIVGMIITLFCLIAPFLVAKGLHIKQQLHPIIYAFSGGMGVAISVILNLFPSWLPFFIIAIGIIVIVLTYFVNNRGSGGG